MSAQNGKDLLIKIDLSSAGQFKTIADLRATRMSFNAESLDVTSLDSEGGWREILGGAGVRSATLTGSGIFKDADTDERARQIVSLVRCHSFRSSFPISGSSKGRSRSRR